jgi:hypothetical protein
MRDGTHGRRGPAGGGGGFAGPPPLPLGPGGCRLPLFSTAMASGSRGSGPLSGPLELEGLEGLELEGLEGLELEGLELEGLADERVTLPESTRPAPLWRRCAVG